jgi:hypothetical protein
MDSLTTLCIFIVILFLYIHIANQFKISEETEIYESDFNNNNHLNEICELKQPVLMNMEHVCPSLFSDIIPETIAKYSSHDICLKDCNDYFLPNTDEQVCYDPIILPLHTSIKFLETDKSCHLFSENNYDFLEETGLNKKIEKIDEFIKPHFCVHSKHDLLFGSPNTVTPFRYHIDNRTFLTLTSGKIRLKMTPWKSTKYLQLQKDYEHFEFRSLVHPTKPRQEHQHDFEKIDFIEFDMKPGYMLYIPPYWYYSIIYLDDPSTFVCKISYNTIMNQIANIKDLSLYFLQQQNITRSVGNKRELKEIIEEPKEELPQNNSEDPKEEIEEVQEQEKVHPDISNNVLPLETMKEKKEKKEKEEENITYSVSSI